MGPTRSYDLPPMADAHAEALAAEQAMAAEFVAEGQLRGITYQGELIGVVGPQENLEDGEDQYDGPSVLRIFAGEGRTIVLWPPRAEQTFDRAEYDRDVSASSGPLEVTADKAKTLDEAIEVAVADILSDDDDDPVDSAKLDHKASGYEGDVGFLEEATVDMYTAAQARVHEVRAEAARAAARREHHARFASAGARLSDTVMQATFPEAYAALHPAPVTTNDETARDGEADETARDGATGETARDGEADETARDGATDETARDGEADETARDGATDETARDGEAVVAPALAFPVEPAAE